MLDHQSEKSLSLLPHINMLGTETEHNRVYTLIHQATKLLAVHNNLLHSQSLENKSNSMQVVIMLALTRRNIMKCVPLRINNFLII